jgi:hypothetical protein
MRKACKSCELCLASRAAGCNTVLLTRVDIAPCACDNVLPMATLRTPTLVLCWRFFAGMHDIKKNYKRR